MPLLLAVLLSLVLAPAAHAAWFPAESVDGPSPDIERFGGVDVARDGTGGLVYVKREAAVPHVFVSRLAFGQWLAPERVDTGLEAPVTEAAVAGADSHRLAVVWIAGSRVYGALYPEGPTPGPVQGPVLVYEDAAGRTLSDLALDMGINGSAFATFTAATEAGGGDVRAVRLMGTTWEAVSAPLDVSEGQDAGRGASRSRVAVAADGNPVVVWGESHADGRRRAYVRRIFGLALSAFPQEMSVAELDGRPAGDADSPAIDIEWDGSFAWAVWRQDVGGVSRTLTRRLRGSRFAEPAAIDGGQAGSTPDVAVNGRGTGFTASVIGDTVAGAEIQFDKLLAAQRIDAAGGRSGRPVVAVSDNDNVDVGFAWSRGAELRGRYRAFEQPFEDETTISRPEHGPVAADAYGISADRQGNVAVGALAGDPGARRIVAAVYDVLPGTASTAGDRPWQRRSQPLFRWESGLDLWGQQSFKVLVDGVEIGRTTATTFRPATPIPDGRHTWRIVAVDGRGQEKPGTVRRIGVDATAPRVVVRVTGRRRAGNVLQIQARAFDGRGSGARSYLIDFGDRSRPVAASRASHRFRAGTFTIRVKVTDRVGNARVTRVRVRVRR